MQALHCHPSLPAPAGLSLTAGVFRRGAATLVFRYVLEGAALQTIHFPAPLRVFPAPRGERLWEHTCFEAFLAAPTPPAYREFNFSPSGEWAACDFSDYRTCGTLAELTQAPQIQVRATENHLELTAALDCADGFFFPETSKAVAVGLSAVLENAKEASLTYWALRHATERPDFHHRGGFVYSLNP